MDINIAVHIICKQLPNVCAIYFFGSVATHTDNVNSDIDIAILPAHPINPIERWNLGEIIARTMNRDVDLIDLSQASTVMRFQIISTGKRIYASNTLAAEKFEDLVYSSYLRFNDERKELLADIKTRGHIL